MSHHQPRVGLALSGGVAWGMVHLGVLQVLERAGIAVAGFMHVTGCN